MCGACRRWALFLSGAICAIWLLAIHAFIDHLIREWPSVRVDAFERSPADGSRWKLRTRNDVAPITATTIALPGGRWGLRLEGIDRDDVLYGMGFRDTDVLIAVDGGYPSSPRAALAAYGRILAEEVEHVVVARDGRHSSFDLHAGTQSTSQRSGRQFSHSGAPAKMRPN